MVHEFTDARLTVDGNTISLKTAEPSDDLQELVCTAGSPKGGEVEVRYRLQLDTPTDSLKELFNNEYSITPAGTHHKLLVEGSDLSVVYANPYYPNGI